VDYTLSGGTLTFDPGEKTKAITVALADDASDELDETLVLTLSGAVGGTLGAAKIHTLSLLDNYDPPSVAFDLATSAGSESSAGSLAVSLSSASARPVSVKYAVAVGGTAKAAGVDFTLLRGTLTFPAGQTSGVIAIPINNDTLPEATETIRVVLSAPVGAVLGTRTIHTYAIEDNEPAPTISFAAVNSSVSEQVGVLLLTVTLSTASSLPVAVDYAITGGSATAGSDVILANDTLSFSAGQSSKTIRVTIVRDTNAESDETFVISFFNPINATVGAADSFTGTILAT
jgi:hypothetical protein